MARIGCFNYGGNQRGYFTDPDPLGLNFIVFELDLLPISNDSQVVIDHPQLRDVPCVRLNKSVSHEVLKTDVKIKITVLNISEYISNKVQFSTGEQKKFGISDKIDVDNNGVFVTTPIDFNEFLFNQCNAAEKNGIILRFKKT